MDYERVAATVERSSCSSCCRKGGWTIDYRARNDARFSNPRVDVVRQDNGKSQIVFEATGENGRRFRHTSKPITHGALKIGSQKNNGTHHTVTTTGSDPTNFFQ